MTETELKIIESAKAIFSEKGLENAKMQDIADHAGISRTSLNYYYRTKENLFQALVEQIFDSLLPKVSLLSLTDVTIESIIEQVVDIYFDILCKNEVMPRFLVVQIHQDPHIIHDFVERSEKAQSYLSLLGRLLQNNMKITIPKEEVLSVFFGLMTTPFLLSPLLELYWEDREEMKKRYIESHKKTTKNLLITYLQASLNLDESTVAVQPLGSLRSNIN